MDVHEIAAIQQLYALYGHAVDDRDWPRLTEVFTADAVFDATDVGAPLMESLAGIQAVMSAAPPAQMPLAHHATNVLVESIDGDRARVRAKTLAIFPKGVAFSGVCEDALVKTADGWRIEHRVNRRREPVPPPAEGAPA